MRDPVVERLRNVNVLVDMNVRAHWLQETCDLGAERLAAAIDALREAETTMAHARVFVTSRERIKRPEGEELYDECLEKIRAVLKSP